MPRQSRYDDAAEAYDGPSKTQQKQDSRDLLDLGTELLKLSAAQLDGIPMDVRVRSALREQGRMPTREAKRRHMQYLGKLLREGDAAPLREALRAIRAGETRLLAEAEQWRDKLLAGDAALTDWIKAHPEAEIQPLRALVRNARREIAGAGDDESPEGIAAARGKSKAFRDLFQVLRSTLKLAERASRTPASPSSATDETE